MAWSGWDYPSQLPEFMKQFQSVQVLGGPLLYRNDEAQLDADEIENQVHAEVLEKAA